MECTARNFKESYREFREKKKACYLDGNEESRKRFIKWIIYIKCGYIIPEASFELFMHNFEILQQRGDFTKIKKEEERTLIEINRAADFTKNGIKLRL